MGVIKHAQSDSKQRVGSISKISFGMTLIFLGQVDSTEFAESAESTGNYNYLTSLIEQSKNYLLTYSDAFSRILSVKNYPNFIAPPSIPRFWLWPYT